jgi:hypothetical protein
MYISLQFYNLRHATIPVNYTSELREFLKLLRIVLQFYCKPVGSSIKYNFFYIVFDLPFKDSIFFSLIMVDI